MKEQRSFFYFKCPECEFDCVLSAQQAIDLLCALCFRDSGRQNLMTRRVCCDTDRPEGYDARTKQRRERG